MATESSCAFREVEFPRIREGAIDLLREAQRKHMIHALLEVDVTDACLCIREHKTRTGEALSFTAFVAACLAKAVDEDKTLHAYRRGRRRLVLFDEVDVNVMVERRVGDSRMGTPNIIRGANTKGLRQIHDEIRSAQAGAVEEAQGMEWFRWAPIVARLPRWLRSLAWRAVQRNPHALKRVAGTVGITAVGMFARGMGWGLTIPFLTLNTVLGGIAEKQVLLGGRVETREFLCVTISVDHDVIDGGLAARFAGRFKELIESSYGLAEATGCREPASSSARSMAVARTEGAA